MLTHKDICKAVGNSALKYKIKNAYYFGSYAKGTQTDDSDLDLLVEFEPAATLLTLAGLIGDLEDTLRKEVDVVILPLEKDSHLILERVVKCYADKQKQANHNANV
ncbi:MAG: nucleotidyltransferase family protein [Synergistaceae bacterium]|nr:nucleotidyltransferase family protein [Synergistaceae bacterium]